MVYGITILSVNFVDVGAGTPPAGVAIAAEIFDENGLAATGAVFYRKFSDPTGFADLLSFVIENMVGYWNGINPGSPIVTDDTFVVLGSDKFNSVSGPYSLRVFAV